MKLTGISEKNYNELKAFADIEINGGHPYSESIMEAISLLPEKEIKEFLAIAQNSAKENKFIGDDIYLTLEKLRASKN